MVEILYVKTRTEWRKWLEANFSTKSEVWFRFPKKSSGMEAVPYSDVVEEALCFGWIDSTYRPHDAHSNIQRYSVRNPRSSYSQLNKERIKILYAQNMIHHSVVESVKFIIDEQFVFPHDIILQLQNDPAVWENFNRFSEPYKRIRIGYIDSARKSPEEFAKRLQHFIDKTAQNKLIKGYGGTERYY